MGNAALSRSLEAAPAGAAAPNLAGLDLRAWASAQGNASVSRHLATGSPGAVLAREDKPGELKVDPKTLSNPFDYPKVVVEVEKLAVTELRGLAGDLVTAGLLMYFDAVSTVAKELEAKKKAEEEKREMYVNIVLSVGMMALGPAMAAAAPKIAGPVLHDKVRTGVSEKMGDFAKAAGVSDDVAVKWMKADVYSALSNDTLTNLAAKFDAEKAKGAIGAAADKAKDKTGKIYASMDKYANGAAYLEQLKNAAGEANKDLQLSLRGMQTYDELMGVYNTFKNTTRENYMSQIRVQTDNFMEQIAPIIADKAKIASGNSAGAQGYTMVRVDAYGKKRLCFADYDYSQGGYHFKSWVTPDMEKTAEALKPQEISGAAFLDGLPAPDKQEEKERIVKMDAWGKIRLAVVKTVDAGTFTTDIQTVFVRWIPEEDRIAMEAQAEATQIGGLATVDPATLKGLKAPPGV